MASVAELIEVRLGLRRKQGQSFAGCLDTQQSHIVSLALVGVLARGLAQILGRRLLGAS